MRWIVALAALLTAAPSIPQEATPGYFTEYSTAMPPDRFRHDNVALVFFVSNIDAFCGAAPAGMTKIACAGRTKAGARYIVMPNPSRAAVGGDAYAQIMAHELGHVSGWAGDHPL